MFTYHGIVLMCQ